MNKLLSSLLILFFTGISLVSKAQDPPPFIKNVIADTFKILSESSTNGIILDVRTPEEIANGYISNASMINFYDENFVEKINLIPKDKEVYVYCKAGGRGSQAALLLQKNGFTKVYNLEGGIMAWEAKNFLLVKPENTTDEHIQQLSLTDFNKMLETEQPVLIDFHTLWCSPCKKMAPVVDKIEKEYKDKAAVMRIDIDKSKEVAKAYNITSIPVFVVFKNGKEIWRHVGMISEEELKKQIDLHL